ncbi:SAM dependent carboxyl methyltransferase [Corchorus capsularis]|uniref:SAM dependent carboxyl methyltransferase n=1 Tax=Corchorus capsularis TaxID=210143 RepID=A0A1R3GBX2_COCAP|nr:SAM dependent carboxyl methyltransferase [Corchorus capsularis]
MAHKGLVSEDKLDSFNLPRYNPTPRELEGLIKKNSCFSIERMERIIPSKTKLAMASDNGVGLISKEKVETFNLPLYYASPTEIEKLIQDNGCFGIERMETFPGTRKNIVNLQMWPMTVRAAFEAMIRNHFGGEMVEELFEIYNKKHSDNVSIFERDDVLTLVQLNIVLKRKN